MKRNKETIDEWTTDLQPTAEGGKRIDVTNYKSNSRQPVTTRIQ